MGKVTPTAKRLLGDAVKQSGRHSTVQIPGSFARITEATQTSTPLARLFLQGEVPLKLYLTLLMLTRMPPHELYKQYADPYWANLFGFEERSEARPAPGAGTRRVKRALAALESGWDIDGPRIVRTVEAGRGPVLQVIHPAGPVTAPYITLPLELWSRGWINVMSARALYVFVCLRLMFVSKEAADPVHVSRWERERFAARDDTWQRGIAELVRLGLLRKSKEIVAADGWSHDRRLRSVLYFEAAVLRDKDSPTLPV